MITGKGFTVMVYVAGVPVQELAVAVTAIVAATGVIPGLDAVKDGTLSDPLAARPMEV